MKLWVFKKDNGEVIFVSEEKGRGKIIIYSLNNMGIVVKKEDTWGYMHRKDGVYIHRHREVQREVRVYTKKEEETCESRKKRKIT